MAHDLEDYTIGWIAALPHELAAATGMLDEKHDLPANFIKNASDDNQYTWGRIGSHCIVLASLPSGEYGTNSAATTAAGMRASLPHIRIGLMVGIGAGIPGPENERDIRLGDVIVSLPQGTSGGVVQYDLAKLKAGQKLYRTGHLNQPPRALLTALAKIRSQHELDDPKLSTFIQQMLERYPRLAKNAPGKASYRYQGSENDRLFRSDYEHAKGPDCRHCLQEGEIARDGRDSPDPEIHYGIIASGNLLVKDATKRDEILETLDEECICFEMEAAGLMNSFPCLVIRGVCDYADSHKNDRWQRYAAATAAAFAKELLGHMDAVEVRRAPKLVEAVKETLDEVSGSVRRTQSIVTNLSKARQMNDLRAWLSAEDPTPDFRAARDQHYAGTSLWFLDGPDFRGFLERKTPFLWLSGLAGCGKTVLSGSVISFLQEKAQLDRAALAYFYFTFRDTKKQTLEQALRSLILQLAGQSETANSKAMASCTQSHQTSSTTQLETLLDEVVMTYDCVRIVLDALDESSTKTQVTKWIEKALHHCKGTLQIVVTSRDEEEIESSLHKWMAVEARVALHQTNIDPDIAAYVHATLLKDERFDRWRDRRDVRERIGQTLTEKSGGMFRWAALQIDSLASCYNMTAVEHALTTLPLDLPSTYNRMLKQIPKVHLHDAERLLQLIIGARRPLSLDEVVDALAVDLGADRSFKAENKIPQPREILMICPNLIRLDAVADQATDEIRPHVETLSLAHFSVKEFLTSCYANACFHASFNTETIETNMAFICLTYLRHVPVDVQKAIDKTSVYPRNYSYPLINYCFNHWDEHVGAVEDQNDEVCSLTVHVFNQEDLFEVLAPWARSKIEAAMSLKLTQIATILTRNLSDNEAQDALIDACILGATGVVQILLHRAGAEGEALSLNDALSHACTSGHSDIVRLLIQAGYEPSGNHGKALFCAVEEGHERIVDLLLEHQTGLLGHYEDAFFNACLLGHQTIVRKFLDKGVNVEIREPDPPKWFDDQYTGCYDRTALHIACAEGHQGIAMMLLAHRADANAGCRSYEESVSDIRPLHLACGIRNPHVCYSDIRDLIVSLVGSGADIRAADSRGVTALCIAAGRDEATLVSLLLDKGADIHPAWAGAPSAIFFAAGLVNHVLDGHLDDRSKEGSDYRWQEDYEEALKDGCKDHTVAVLLRAGADLTSTVDGDKTPLHFAAEGLVRNSKTLELLVEAGASINQQDADGRSPLHYAAGYTSNPQRLRRCSTASLARENAVELLLKAGADLKLKDSDEASPLHWAATRSGAGVVRALLHAGADVHEPDGLGQTPLHRACSTNTKNDVVAHLLQAGADPEIAAQDGSTALHWAAVRSGDLRTLEILLQAGADPKRVASDGTAPLHWAAAHSQITAIIALTKGGADVNCRDKAGNTPLHAALTQGKLFDGSGTIAALLEAGGDPTLTNDRKRSPLHVAALNCHHDAMKVLLENEYARSTLEQPDEDGKTPLALLHSLGARELHLRHLVSIKLLSLAQTRDLDPDTAQRPALEHLNRNFFERRFDPEEQKALEADLASRKHPAKLPDLRKATVLHAVASRALVGTFVHSSKVKDVEAITLCADLGADLDVEAAQGRSPLHFAALTGGGDRVEALFKRGAIVHARDRLGRTPLDYAKKEFDLCGDRDDQGRGSGLRLKKSALRKTIEILEILEINGEEPMSQ